jgi:hypothetical protein
MSLARLVRFERIIDRAGPAMFLVLGGATALALASVVV